MSSKELMTIDFSADAGAGLEQADSESYAIPFLSILQGLSPQIETVEGARPGLFINTVTDQISKTVRVIPCSYTRRYLQWAPRSEGGGFRGEHQPKDVETGKVGQRGDDGRFYIGDDLLKDTRSHYVLVETEDGNWSPAMLSLSSTQIKKSKRWMSMIQGIKMGEGDAKFTPPMFSHVYELGTVKEENSEGSWWGLTVKLDGPVTDAVVYAEARAFSQEVAQGRIKTETETTETGF